MIKSLIPVHPLRIVLRWLAFRCRAQGVERGLVHGALGLEVEEEESRRHVLIQPCRALRRGVAVYTPIALNRVAPSFAWPWSRSGKKNLLEALRIVRHRCLASGPPGYRMDQDPHSWPSFLD